jgi:hypothetical protein
MKELCIVLSHFDPSHGASLSPIIAFHQQQTLKMQFDNLPKIKFRIEKWPLLL